MKKRDILLYLTSFILLAISFIMFIFAFIYVNRGIYFIYSGTALVLFCIANKLTEKKIRCNDGYNLLQAYLFYKKCEKHGINIKTSKLKATELSVISDIASDYDYCKEFNETQLKNLYEHGRETCMIIEKTK